MNKERVLKLIGDVLIKDERVVFAYAFGSFLKEEPFRDIDIGIYVKDPQVNPFIISSDLKTEISRFSKQKQMDFDADRFDVRVVNDAPFTFLFRVFTEGKLLLDRDSDLRTDVIEQVSLKYRECTGLLAEASLL